MLYLYHRKIGLWPGLCNKSCVTEFIALFLRLQQKTSRLETL